MKKTVPLCLLAALLWGCGSLFYKRTFTPKKLSGKPNLVEKPGWKLIFSDEFNNRQLDRTKWQTLPYYGVRVDPSFKYRWWSDKNFRFTDSTIQLTLGNDSAAFDGKYYRYSASYMENSPAMDQQYGYYELRCKVPYSKGTWPAFWLVSKHKWPPEIDIFEMYTSESTVKMCSNLHWDNKPENKEKTGRANQWNEEKHKIPDPRKKFHVYGCEWNEKEIKWYFDNVLVRTESTKGKGFDYKMHVAINLDLQRNKDVESGNFFLDDFMEVDYVRVYTKLPNEGK